MTTVEFTDYGGRMDGREIGQERARGTVDIDGTGAATITVPLSGELEDVGMGLFGIVDVGDGTAEITSVTPDEVTADVTGATADATGVGFELVVSEDGFYRDSGIDLATGA